MALLPHPAFRHPALGRIRAALQSRVVLGDGYSVAAGLTGLAILLAASPPAKGPLGPASQLILTVLGFNLVLILGLIAAVSLRILELLRARSHDAGARLHVRFVRLFALAALVPALVVFVFSGVLVSQGVDKWFSERVQTVVENSATVFRSYIEEQTRDTADRVTSMAQDLNREAAGLQGQAGAFDRALSALASYHGFPALYLVTREGQVMARAEATAAPTFEGLPASAFAAADRGEIFVRADNVIRALYRLPDYGDVYLYAVRPLEQGVVANLRDAESALVSYREIGESRARVQTIFALSYVETALLVLVGAVWLGVTAAHAIWAPVARLVQAAGRVAGGDLSARVDADGDPDEIAVLSRAFNSMTHDLQAQQEALRRAGEEAEERRQFIETVLAEVSAGVIGLDSEGRISVANRQAEVLLALPGGQGRGRKLSEVVPEVAELAAAGRSGEAEGEIEQARRGGR